MLHAQQLIKQFGTTNVVDCLDVDVEVGQIRGLLGPNGAGKTTTLRMICGVLTPTSGSVTIGGHELCAKPREAKQLLGYVPEGAPLPVELTPSEYFHFTMRMHGVKDKSTAIDKWTSMCDITDVMTQQIGTLSRGFRQRVALVAALLHEPKLLVLDEPSSGLDPAQHVAFRSLLEEVSNHAGVLYSSHNLYEVEATCDVVTVICDGTCVKDGSFDEITDGGTQFVAEVSPHHVASSMQSLSSEVINTDWMRLIIESKDGEQIAVEVAQAGGTIRLLQPNKNTLESAYLELIRQAEHSV